MNTDDNPDFSILANDPRYLILWSWPDDLPRRHLYNDWLGQLSQSIIEMKNVGVCPINFPIAVRWRECIKIEGKKEISILGFKKTVLRKRTVLFLDFNRPLTKEERIEWGLFKTGMYSHMRGLFKY